MTKTIWLLAVAVVVIGLLGTLMLRHPNTTNTPVAQDTDLQAVLAHLSDTSVPLQDRLREVKALGLEESAHSRRILMALGDQKTYLNRSAIDALADIPTGACSPDVAVYLKGKLSDPDCRVLGAALVGFAHHAGVTAIPDIAEVMKRNRQRTDGFSSLVLSAAVTALDNLKTPSTVSILVGELARSGEEDWDLDYGSQIVAALGGTNTPASRAALVAYADRLTARKPSDSMAGTYIQKKIDEARAAAAP